MKKIISAFDGYKFSESAKDYTIYLAKQTNAHVVGVFLDDVWYHSYRLADVHFGGNGGGSNLKQLDKQDQEKRDHAVHTFENDLQIAKLNYSIHRDKESAFPDLLHETVYSDLLVISKDETFTRFEESVPTRFIAELLAETQCPVLLVPHTFRPVNKVVLLYNGKPSSVYAIKMFSYLLPSLKHLEVEVLTVNDEKQSLHLPDNKLMKEFMHRHFPQATFNVLKGDFKEEIVTYLKLQKENTLAVLGAYQRNMVSRLLKRSLADELMEKVNLPLFIAHNG